MRRITLAGVDLELWEGGDGPPILFLHGAGGFRPEDGFVGLLEPAAPVIAPSHPGSAARRCPAGSTGRTTSPSSTSNCLRSLATRSLT